MPFLPLSVNFMENRADLSHHLEELVITEGAYKAAVIDTECVETDASFRALCASNVCGAYGRCWMCPPDVGEIELLMKTLRTFDHALVYQTVWMLEDSYDIEGMGEAADAHARLSLRLAERCKRGPFSKLLHLAAGGCHVCPTCAKVQNQSCRFPDRALPSLEAYGVNVSRLAAAAGMKYINGQNTVTYFGAIFFNL